MTPEGERRVTSEGSTPKACPSCAARYPADALFCSLDGAPLTTAPGAVAAAAATDAYLGREILGHIEIRQLVGIGAMGRVYRAFQSGIDRDVAVKILHRELSASETLVGRFHREAKVASRLAHPNVVHVLLVGQLPDGALYIVMEYLDGMSLQSALAAAGGSMPLARALHIALQLCEAAGEAHARKIVHRDLKPENVMLVHRADDPDFVKVLDFGIARLNWDEASTSTAAGLIFGTARYISPEGARGERVDPQGDVYSIATMIYQMLSGRTPFDAEQAVALLVSQIHDAPPPLKSIARAAHVPDPVASIIMQNLAKKPGDRAVDARAFGRALLDAAIRSGLRAQDVLARPALLAGGRPASTALIEAAEESARETARTKTELTELAPASSAQTTRWTSPVSLTLPAAPLADGEAAAPRGRLPSSVEVTIAGEHADGRPRASAWVVALVILCFLVGALGMAAIASRGGLGLATKARSAQLGAAVARARAALLQKHWDSPVGDNVRELTDDALVRFPGDAELLAVRAGASADAVRAARSRYETGDSAEAIRLARVAAQLDATNREAADLVAQWSGESAAPPPTSPPAPAVPPLASPQQPSSAATAATMAVNRITIDMSSVRPHVGQPVDFVARAAGPAGGARPRVEGPRFRFSGPGIPGGTELPAVDDGSGAFRSTFTFLQDGRFDVAFSGKSAGATLRAARSLAVGDETPPAPPASAASTPQPAGNNAPPATHPSARPAEAAGRGWL